MKLNSLLATVCSVSLLIGTSACSAEPNPLVGTWESKIEMTDFLNDASGDAADFFDWSSLFFTMELELKEDKTFVWQYNEESIENLLKDTRSVYEYGVSEYLDYLIEKENLNMTQEEALDILGMTFEDMVDGMMQQAEDSMKIESFEGTYSIKGDELHLLYEGYDGDAEILKFECDGTSLTIDITDEYDILALDYLLPMTFTKKQ